jgi:hypothetical protein
MNKAVYAREQQVAAMRDASYDAKDQVGGNAEELSTEREMGVVNCQATVPALFVCTLAADHPPCLATGTRCKDEGEEIVGVMR